MHTHAVSPAEERVAVVDHRGNVLREVSRAEMRQGRLMHRATYIAVVNDRLELAIHQRAATKDLWPSYWDLAAGGVLGIDETPQDGAVRELAEELGITAPLAHLGTALYEDTDVSVLGDIFLARHNGPFDYVDGEVQRAEWISLDDLRVALPTRSFCPDSVELVLPRVCSAIED